jgi:hypothetical protein
VALARSCTTLSLSTGAARPLGEGLECIAPRARLDLAERVRHVCDAFGGKHEKIVSVSGVSQTSATLVYNSMCSLRVRLRMVQLLGRGKRADTLSMFSLLPTTVAVCVSTCRRGSYHRGTLGVEHRRRRGEGDETAVQARRQNPARGRQSCGQTDAPVHGHERLVDARVQQQAETAERDVRHVAQMHAGDEARVFVCTGTRARRSAVEHTGRDQVAEPEICVEVVLPEGVDTRS